MMTEHLPELEREVREIQQRMLRRVTQRFIAEGMPVDKAEAAALAALKAPPQKPLPEF